MNRPCEHLSQFTSLVTGLGLRFEVVDDDWPITIHCDACGSSLDVTPPRKLVDPELVELE